MSYDAAQLNVSRLLAPLGSALLEPFVSALDEVNAASPRARSISGTTSNVNDGIIAG